MASSRRRMIEYDHEINRQEVEIDELCAQHHRAAPAGGARPALHHARAQGLDRPGAHRRPVREHRRPRASSWASCPASNPLRDLPRLAEETGAGKAARGPGRFVDATRCARDGDRARRRGSIDYNARLFVDLLSRVARDSRARSRACVPLTSIVQLPRAHRRPRHQPRREASSSWWRGSDIRHPTARS